MRQRQNGFTLIELLIVIAIIGILATIIYSAVNTVRAKARDAKRVSTLRQYATALELFYDKYGKYPCGDGVFNNQTRVGIDGPGDNEFLNGDPTGGTGGDNPPNGCPDAPGSNETDPAGDPRTGLKTESFYNESLPNGITGDPLNTMPFHYVYWVAKDRQSYIMTARLEQNDSRMSSDGGKCAGRYETGPGINEIIVPTTPAPVLPFDYWYNESPSIGCLWQNAGICAPLPTC